jgi:hypothetical protein
MVFIFSMRCRLMIWSNALKHASISATNSTGVSFSEIRVNPLKSVNITVTSLNCLGVGTSFFLQFIGYFRGKDVQQQFITAFAFF